MTIRRDREREKKMQKTKIKSQEHITTTPNKKKYFFYDQSITLNCQKWGGFH